MGKEVRSEKELKGKADCSAGSGVPLIVQYNGFQMPNSAIIQLISVPTFVSHIPAYCIWTTFHDPLAHFSPYGHFSEIERER